MAIVKLLVKRYGGLREVVGSIIRRTAVVVAAGIGQGEVLDAGEVKNITVHDRAVTESPSEVSCRPENSPISGENSETAKCEARGDLPYCDIPLRGDIPHDHEQRSTSIEFTERVRSH